MATPKRGKRWRFISRGAAIRIIVLLAMLTWMGGCMMWMPGESYQGQLLPMTDSQTALSAALRDDVSTLTQHIGERNVGVYAGLTAAADFIEDQFKQAGYQVSRQTFKSQGRDVSNIEAEKPGTDEPDRIVVIGAHYDSLPGTVGANDNATGVAAVLALARAMAQKTSGSTLRFLAFVNEEPPFFQRQPEEMGSFVYARGCKDRGENIVAMVSFDGIGYYSDAEGSQNYPFPFSLFYPSQGNFIGFVGNTSSSDLVRQVIGTFRRNAQFPSEGAAMPGWMPGVSWSDHWSFWQQGYKGVMVTDTLPFRYGHYHEPTDTADKLDFDRMARVVQGMQAVVADLAAVKGP